MSDRLKIKKFLSLLTAYCSLLAVFGCAINPVTGGRELMLVSENQEIELGKELYPNALWGDIGGGGEYKDERLKAYLKDIVLRIHSASHRPNLPVEFAIQNSSIPNAWAIPGYVVITRGLLSGLENEAEFAFVMGHEMGHVSARHSARQMTYGMVQGIGLAAAGIALSGKQSADLFIGIGSLGSSLLMLKFSRNDELEADRLGITYMTRLGYNPHNAVSAHRNLERISSEYMKSAGKTHQEQTFLEELFSTHPRTSVRIDEIQHIINTMPPYTIRGDGSGRLIFQDMTQELRKRNRIYTEYHDNAVRAFGKDNLNEAYSFASSAVNADQSQAPFHAVKGFVMLKKKSYHEAWGHFNDALKWDTDYQPAHRGIGAVNYFRERYHEAIGSMNKALKLFPNDISSHYFIGMSHFKTRNYKTAIRHLRTVSEAQPSHPEIHGILGICYENINDIQSAYEQYVTQLKVNPTNEMGRHAASRIAVLRFILEGSKMRR